MEGDVALALAEPCIAEPDIQGPFRIDKSFRFMALMSSGLLRAWETATNSCTVNADLVAVWMGTLFRQIT